MESDFNSLYNIHKNGVYHFILNKTNNVHDAEELCNETFIKVSNHIDKYNPNLGAISTWIFTIAKHLIIDYYRKKKHHNYSIDEFWGDGECTIEIHSNSLTPHQQLEQTELCDEIKNYINKYSIIHQEIFKLRFYEGLNYNEISETLHIPLGTIKGSIHRVTQDIQKKFKFKYQS